MKTIYTMTLALAICATANADNPTLQMLSFGSEAGPGKGEPGMLGLGISPDGRYVCGTLENGIGIFIGDLDNDKMIFNIPDDGDGGQLLNINNQGTAIGFNGAPGVTFNIDGVETPLRVSEEYKYVVGQDISDDGSVEVGLLVGKGYQIFPAYSKDGGIWQTLPMPDLDLGDYNTRQCGARYVSSDGKIILGYIGALGPATLWRLNDAGEYEADPFFDEYAMRTKEDTDHPYVTFEAEGLSPDGHYVLIKVCDYVDGIPGENMPAVYDTVTRELKVYDEPQQIDTYGIGLTPTAIANDGTFIGMWGSAVRNGGAFIMKAGQTQAEMYTTAFPEFAPIFELLDMCGYHMPADISADGNRIIGNGWYSPDEDPTASDALFYFMTYVIDRGLTDGVQAPEAAHGDAIPVAYHTLDGMTSATPVKGINIVRMSDGSVRKVMHFSGH
ncbi:MAG: hypothetical protein K2F87_06450 [Muribaculaceae bacterium]|nr:hypothetical protein [Muribaculaceae bacterium]